MLAKQARAQQSALRMSKFQEKVPEKDQSKEREQIGKKEMLEILKIHETSKMTLNKFKQLAQPGVS